MNGKVCMGGYQTPELEIVNVVVEQGFAGTGGEGGGFSGYGSDSDDSEFG